MTQAAAVPPEPHQALSPAEQRFERLRRTTGLLAGPASFVLLWFLPLAGLSPAAHRLVAVLAWVVVWWMTEAIPIPATAVLGPALVVLLRVDAAKETFAAFGDPIIFLFLGGFLIAEAMSAQGLDRRIAYALLGSRLVAGSPTRVLLGFALLAMGLSMWISNTATTAMLYPIALGAIATLAQVAVTRQAEAGSRRLPYATGLLLACAYGSSIGGIGTPVGTPPNLIVIGQLDALTGTRISFFQWMLISAPVMFLMMAFAALYLRRRFPAPHADRAATSALLVSERTRLGRMGRGERNVIAAFALAVVLWILPGAAAALFGGESSFVRSYQAVLPESVVAVLAASLLFVLPVDWRAQRFTLTWHEAVRIDWGTLLIFGGGLALGGAMFRTGLASALGHGLTSLTGVRSEIGLTYVFAIFAIYFTELTSNTAAATMLAPLAIAAAGAVGVSPVPVAVGAGLGCSMAFMLPVSTPPNAIIYGSGRVPITAMVRSGVWMTLCAAVVVPTAVLLMCRLLGY
jgi:solute carrier family 13 (sodium-dependent dicarboxylate transporter), member 2/3/5